MAVLPESTGMKDTDLFQMALGLVPPWLVQSSSFQPDEKRLEIRIDFPSGSRLPCPECGEGCPVHDTTEKRWRHLDFFQHQAFLVARVPRVECGKHGVKQVTVPWARPGSGFTLLFEGLILAMAPHMAVKRIAVLMREHDTLIWRIIRHHVAEARSRADHRGVTTMAFDETAARRGHDYVTIAVDVDKRRVLYACPGRDGATIAAAAEDLRAHGGDPGMVTGVACDLSPAFTAGITKHLPNAEITYDRFHVTQLVTDALEEIRREEQRQGGWRGHLLKGHRWALLRNPANQSPAQEKAAEMIAMPLLHLKTGRAYRLKLAFQEAYADSPEALKRWCNWAVRSHLPAMAKAARSIRKHWDGIVRWFTSDITSAIMEGFNSLFQAAKSRARGYRNHQYFIDMIYLIGAKLDFSASLGIHTK